MKKWNASRIKFQNLLFSFLNEVFFKSSMENSSLNSSFFCKYRFNDMQTENMGVMYIFKAGVILGLLSNFVTYLIFTFLIPIDSPIWELLIYPVITCGMCFLFAILNAVQCEPNRDFNLIFAIQEGLFCMVGGLALSFFLYAFIYIINAISSLI